MSDSYFTCFVEGRGNDWFALCLELDISVQGRSLEDVTERIEGAVRLYLERLRELPETDRQRLLRRRVPFWTSLKIASKMMWNGVVRPRTGSDESGGKTPHRYNYPLHCPA
jgi:predicted RNase H-like HicB family nuclease